MGRGAGVSRHGSILAWVNAALILAIGCVLALPSRQPQVTWSESAIDAARPMASQGAPSAPRSTNPPGVGPRVRVSGRVASVGENRAVLLDGANCYVVQFEGGVPELQPDEDASVDGVLEGPDPWTQAIRIRAAGKAGAR